MENTQATILIFTSQSEAEAQSFARVYTKQHENDLEPEAKLSVIYISGEWRVYLTSSKFILTEKGIEFKV